MADQQNDNGMRGMRTVGLVTLIPMVMLAGLLVGYYFGNWIDGRFGTSPWGKIVLSILGTVAGIKQTIGLIQEVIRDSNR